MTDSKLEVILGFLLFPTIVLFATVGMLYYAWTLGMPAIKLAHAYGIGLIAGLFKAAPNETKGEKDLLSELVTWAVKPVIALAVGGLVKFFLLS
jgi:phosphate/sulfate permease